MTEELKQRINDFHVTCAIKHIDSSILVELEKIITDFEQGFQLDKQASMDWFYSTQNRNKA